jgi:two-component system, OmpR family, phosphate regulon sensor histidine kinase PhoR
MATIIVVILIAVIFFLIIYLHRIRASLKEISVWLKEYLSGNLSACFAIEGKGMLNEVAKDICTILDRTNRRIEGAVQEAQRMDAILRGMTDALLITDMKGSILFANRAFRKLFRINEKIEGRQFVEVLRNAQVIDLFKRSMDTWEIMTEEITVELESRDINLVATSVPVYTLDSISGAVITLHDITRLKKLEAIRTDFVANVTHEIKTPLTAIQGCSETLLDGAYEDRENARRFLDMIRDHSKRLNTLVDDLLTLSKIELGDLAIQKSEVNCREVISTVFHTLEEKAKRKSISLSLSLPEGEQAVPADRDRLIQILINLVENGIKYTEKGGVTVALTRISNRCELTVEDSGIGIPHHHLERLGERFYRVDRARSRDMGGTGLGLAIVKHLVKAHGWEMTIESTPGKGTTVRITITPCPSII